MNTNRSRLNTDQSTVVHVDMRQLQADEHVSNEFDFVRVSNTSAAANNSNHEEDFEHGARSRVDTELEHEHS